MDNKLSREKEDFAGLDMKYELFTNKHCTGRFQASREDRTTENTLKGHDQQRLAKIIFIVSTERKQRRQLITDKSDVRVNWPNASI